MEQPLANAPRFSLSINTGWKGKPAQGSVNLAEGWRATSFNLAEFRQHIESGYAVSTALLAGSSRSDDNFVSSQLVFVDVDNKDPRTKGWKDELSVEAACQLPIVKDHAAYLYYSPSHQQSWERFRIVWVAPIPIDDKGVYANLVRWVQSQIPGADKRVSSVTNLFYGSTFNATHEPPLYNDRTFPLEWIDKACDWAAARETTKVERTPSPLVSPPVSLDSRRDPVDLKDLLGSESARILTGTVGDRSDDAMKLLLDLQGCENWCHANGVPTQATAIDEWDAACREIYSGEKERFIQNKMERLLESCRRGHGEPETWESSIASMYGAEGVWKRVKALYPCYRDSGNRESILADLLDDGSEEALLSGIQDKVACLPGVEKPKESDEIVRRFKALEEFIAKTLAQRGLPTIYRLALIREQADTLKLRRLLKEDELVRLISRVAQEQRGGATGPVFPGDRKSRPVIPADVIENLLPAKNLSILFGPPKAAKTSFAVGMMKALVSGEDFLGMQTRHKGKIIWICDDQSEEDTYLQADKAGLYDHPRIITWHNWTIDDLSQLEDLIRDPRTGEKPLVVIDSLTSISRNSGVDENSPAIGFLLYELKETLNALGATTLLIHHSNKGGAGLNAARGSTSITGAAANVIGINMLYKKIDGISVEDRDNPRRRLSASMRRSSMPDILIELDFDDLSVEYISTWDEWERQQKEQEAAEATDNDNLSMAIVRFVQNSSQAVTKTQIAQAVLGEANVRSEDGRGATKEAKTVYRRVDKLFKMGMLYQGTNDKDGLYSCDPEKVKSGFVEDDVDFE